MSENVIGVLCLDTHFAKPPGHIRCVNSQPFKIMKHLVRGATIAELLERPSLEFFAPFIEGAKALEQAGCAAITGSCGFMALYQKELAEAVSIPVFSSSLIHIPLMHQMAGGKGRVGVITARQSALTDAHFEAVGAGHVPVAVAGMQDQPEFSSVILKDEKTDIDADLLAEELCAVGRDLVARYPDVTSIVLECTDLPPYAHRLQQAIGLPVADLTTLSAMVHGIVSRQAYTGQLQYD